jgi:hypothetical protein
MKIQWKFLNLSLVGLFKRKNQEEDKKMFTQSEFNIIYEFLDRVPLKGHNERTALNSVIIKLQKNTVKDNRRSEDNDNRDTDN